MTDLKSIEIMLIDDNRQMRAITAAILQAAGCRMIREMGDGASALESLHQKRVDLAIVDFNMFPLDGVAFTRLVRNSPDSVDPFLPVIMMTGHSAKHRVMEARDAGVTEFVTKPFTPKALLDRVQAVIQNPRAFVRTEGYFGPDRRRRNAPDYAGPWRRATDDHPTGTADEAEVLYIPE